MDDTVAKLSINRLIIIPFTIHPVLQTPLLTRFRARPSVDCSPSYGDIVNYNTRSRASVFLKFFLDAILCGWRLAYLSPEKRGEDEGEGSDRVCPRSDAQIASVNGLFCQDLTR